MAKKIAAKRRGELLVGKDEVPTVFIPASKEIDIEERLNKLEQRIDRLVDAIDKSRRIKGI